MNKVNETHTVFDIPESPKETFPAEPEKNFLSDCRTSATGTVEHIVGPDAKKNIKSETTQSGFSNMFGSSSNPKLPSSSATATTSDTMTTEASISPLAKQTTSAGKTKVTNSNTAAKFTPRFHTPFAPRIQEAFYSSLSHKALDLVEKYRLTKE